jgi:hypothetical protein
MTQIEGARFEDREDTVRFSLHTGLQMNQHGSSLQNFSTICNSRVSACTAVDDSIHRYEITRGAVIHLCNNLGSCVHCDLDSRTFC